MPTVVPLLMFEDNYGYLLLAADGKRAIVVDPSDGDMVWAFLKKNGYELEAVLATHHHYDHVAGIESLCSRRRVDVFCSPEDLKRVPMATRTVGDGEAFVVAGLEIEAIHVPGHTRGHVAYRCGGVLFSGDTLFLGGCGRLFEGTAEELYRSLHEKLLALPEETAVYPGHEYTVRTRSFCHSIDPGNVKLQQELAEARALRKKNLPTVPGLLRTERETNVFLRCGDEDLVSAFQQKYPGTQGDPLSVFSKLRSLMNVY